LARKGGLDRLVRVYVYVMATVYRWRKKTGAEGPVIMNSIEGDSRRVGYPSIECRHAGELYLLELAQKGMKISEGRMLVSEEDMIGRRSKLTVNGSRGRNQIEGIYGQVELPVLLRDHPLSELYTRAAHGEGY
jgi:hypothetical protein